VEGIPAGADALVLEFSDKDYAPLSRGGHGKIGFVIAPGAARAEVPAMPGETFTLPEGFFHIDGHHGWSDAGAHLPPCSGGQSHKYFVTVKAVQRDPANAKAYKELASTQLVLGFY
jgi:hypothetical protein